MTPYATSAGTLRLNWQRKEVGRITRVSGESSPRALHACHTLLDRLYRYGHLRVLEAVRDGHLTMRHLRALDRSGQLDLQDERLHETLLGLQPFWETVQATLPVMGGTTATRRRYAYSFAALAERCAQLPRQATLDTLRRVDWLTLRAQWPAGAKDWNHLRTAVSRLLTLALGSEHHPLRRDVMQAMPLAQAPERISTLTVEGLGQILVHVRPALRPAILTLAVAGLRVGELYALRPEHLVADGDVMLLAIPTVTEGAQAHKDAGTKTGGRLVVVDAQYRPILQQAIPVPTSYKMLYRSFKRAARKAGLPATTLHDLRHLHAAEVTERASVAIAQQSLGHKTPGMTLRYAKRGDLRKAAQAIGQRFAHLTRTGDTPR